MELAERNKEALWIKWTDVVPLDLRLDYMREEQVYCRDEEYAFYTYRGDDANEKERLRTAVLEKRAEFLKMYSQITIKINEELLNVHKPKDSDK